MQLKNLPDALCLSSLQIPHHPVGMKAWERVLAQAVESVAQALAAQASPALGACRT